MEKLPLGVHTVRYACLHGSVLFEFCIVAPYVLNAKQTYQPGYNLNTFANFFRFEVGMFV